MKIKYAELEKKSAEIVENVKKIKMSVLGDCATQHLCKAIKGYGHIKKIDFSIYEADYNQIDMQTVDPDAEAWRFAPEYVLLMMCQEQLYAKYLKTPMQQRYDFAQNIYAEIQNYWINISDKVPNVKIIQSNFMLEDDSVFGNFANKMSFSYIFQLRKLNFLLMEAVASEQFKNVYILDMDMIQQKYGSELVRDARTYYVGKLPAPTKAMPLVAEQIVNIIMTSAGYFKKCLICDLDNTLWGGVIGDDGIEKIQIGELGEGQAYSALQSWIKELKERGIIIAICSKNEADVAREPFVKHPEMVLREDDIAMFVANWTDKATNIKTIQETLNIGMDSIVFIDDNPFERNLVKEAFADITVPDLPDDATEYLPYLKSLNLFETSSYSEEDKQRTAQYQAEAGRTLQLSKFDNYEDYLKSLEMEATIAPFDEFHRPRIAQLTQRSNQFNLRTIRYTENDIEQLQKNDNYITMYVTLKDKYGDHGLISVVVLKKEEDALFVVEWLMSCRVLKRGTEEMVCDTIVELAMKHNANKVVGEYIPTPKNKMVSNLYSNMGFKEVDENRFEVLIEEYVPHATHIAKELKYE